jgi:hypothetical protein
MMSSGPSIGTRVGTRIESSSRHMLQARVDKERMIHALSKQGGGNADETLRRNKMDYCMHKDELVLCCNNNLKKSGHLHNRNNPYPKVITTWQAFTEEQMTHICKIMMQESRVKFYQYLDHDIEMDYQVPDLQALGYSVGIAYAHEANGDTIAAVQIGGLITVQNGAYEIQTGDLVHWYIQGMEEKYFDNDGNRGNNSNSSLNPTKRASHFLRNSGIKRSDKNLDGKGKVFFPKALARNPTYGDKMRVFAKCLSSAGPYEKVDIMIARQAM